MAIVTNANNEVIKLKGLRKEAEQKVRGYLGDNHEIKINATKMKLKTGKALSKEE